MSSLGNKSVMARNLRHYIEASGKDRRELAETWGFPYSTLTNWLNGKKYPRIDKIEIMADYFGILKSDLIEDKSDLIEDKDKPTEDDGLSANQKALMDFAKSVPEEKAGMILRVMRSILEDS